MWLQVTWYNMFTVLVRALNLTSVPTVLQTIKHAGNYPLKQTS